MEAFSLTNGEKLKNMMQDQEFRKTIENSLQKNGHLIRPPVLTLGIIARDGSEYELEEEDIKEVFSRFGTVQKVLIRPNAKALIIFSQAINAAFALYSLNQHEIEDIEVVLKVDWCPFEEIPHEVSELYKNNEIPNNQLKKDVITEENSTISSNKEEKPEENSKNIENVSNANQDFDYNGLIKYTCRFDIQIENERDFQVCRKIIGPKGSNMKQIIEYCCQNKLGDYSYYQEQIKLRLRGKGSGYKEGINHIESNEDLHLCVSSRDYEMYSKACFLIERLLLNIYDEYKLFCMRTGKPFDPNLQIMKKETTTRGPPLFMETPSQTKCPVYYPQMNPQSFYPTYYNNNNNVYNNDLNSYDLGSNFYSPNKSFYPEFNNNSHNNHNNNINNLNSTDINLDEQTILRLIEARNKARKELNFKEADRIRNYLKAKGIALMDEKGARGKGVEVTSWKFIKNSSENDLNNGYFSSNVSSQKAFG